MRGPRHWLIRQELLLKVPYTVSSDLFATGCAWLMRQVFL
jgi:hypothetical protein